MMAEENSKQPAPAAEAVDFERQIVQKIGDSENILVALSRSPSVDEMAAAIALTMFLNRTGKHVTAIYSGETPNALEFLKPEGTFEDNTNSLQDFIIALNKEKADHLRYKLDGDYVKIYITPYKTTISKDDLEFARGDYNVDLVVALNVPTASDLDTALNEHGRIMHDASAIDITTGEPGKFGEIEWSDTGASSVSEMTGRVMMAMADQDVPVTKEEATALMTGIMAATQRFSNEHTTPGAMTMSSKLMELGADQKLIANNIENQTAMMGEIKEGRNKETGSSDPTLLDVREEAKAEEVAEENVEAAADEVTTDGAAMSETAAVPVAAEEVQAEVAADAVAEVPVAPEVAAMEQQSVEQVAEQPAAPEPLPIPMPEPIEPMPIETAPVGAPAGGEMNLTPPEPIGMEEPKDYGAMIDAALAETVPTGPAEPVAVPANEVPIAEAVAQPMQPVENPAAAMAPAVPNAPEENHIPEMNYSAVTPAEQAMPQMVEQPMQTAQPMPAPQAAGQPGALPMPDGQTLPPPPTPPVDFGNLPAADAAGAPVLPGVAPAPVAEQVQAEPQPQPAAADPGAFKIPGM